MPCEARDGAITEYCDDNCLTTSARLVLFAQVCAAVQHAHDQGIVHRDLKPSNVLVTQVNGQPLPKIIDFSVAKAITGHLSEGTLVTEIGALIGTPEYMSPEQADPYGDIDFRTDIYSLGILLYELLVGVLPFDADDLRTARLDEVQRVICEVDPQRPSTRLKHLGTAAARAAERRQTTIVALTRELRGDLDWIVLKAIDKDRARRYLSAGELGDDVGRFVRHEPVSARPPTLRYLAGKYVRRHRAEAGMAAAIFLALSLGIAASTFIFSPEAIAPTAADDTLVASARVVTRSGLVGSHLTSLDGRSVVSIEKGRDRPGWSLWLAEAETGNTERLVDLSGHNGAPIHWTRDGRHLYMVAEGKQRDLGRLQRLSLVDRRIETLKDTFPLTGWPALSPDERYIAGVRTDPIRGRSVLVVANLDGSAEREVATRPLEEPYFMLAWSPDGRTIAASAGNLAMIGKPMQVVSVSLEDGRERPLSCEPWTRAMAKVWLPDGNGLLLLGQKWGHRQSADSWLWRLDIRSGETRPIAAGPDEFAGWRMSLSADGTTLAVARTKLAASVWILPGTDTSRASEIAPAWAAPRFLPDGRLVFTGPDRFIWRTNVDGSDRHRIASGFYKAMAPDGRFIFYTTEQTGGVSQIWRAESDGHKPVQITHGPAAGHPDVSPDGQWLVYTTAVDGALWKMPLAGGEPIRLSGGFTANPSVSPNGQLVAVRFKDGIDGSWEVALVPMRGGGVTGKLELPPGTDLWDLRFSRDGTAIDAALSEDTIGNLWRLPLDGRPLFSSPASQVKNFAHSTGPGMASFSPACGGGWRADVMVIRGDW